MLKIEEDTKKINFSYYDFIVLLFFDPPVLHLKDIERI